MKHRCVCVCVLGGGGGINEPVDLRTTCTLGSIYDGLA